MKYRLALALLCFCVGCDDGMPADAGPNDAGPSDVDSGPGPDDAGTPDGGPMMRPPCTAPAASPYLLLDLGHGEVDGLTRAGDRVLATEPERWVLWGADGSRVTHGGGRVRASSPSTFLVRNGAWCVRSMSDGSLLSMLALTSHGGVATDGSYLWTATDTELSIWSPDGTRRADVSGDYTGAAIHAAPTELRVARGPAGLDLVERIDASTGAATSGAAMNGEFLSWFRDGEHVITRQGSTIWLYDPSGTQVGIYALPTTQGLQGYGEYFWTFESSTPGYPLTLYRVDGGGTALETRNLDVATEVIYSRGRIGLLHQGTDLDIIELTPGTLTNTSFTLTSSNNERFAADDVGWVVASRDLKITAHGTIASPSAEALLGYGMLASVDGTAGGRVALATTSDQILLVDVATGTIERVVELGSDQVELSADGSRLAAATGDDDGRAFPDRTLYVYATADGSELANWISMFDGGSAPHLRTFSFSPDGALMARVFGSFSAGSWSYGRAVTDLINAPVLEDMDAFERPVFSPDGTYFALSRTTPGSTIATTNVYMGDTLVTAVEGTAIGWVGSELVTQRTVPSGSSDITTYTMRYSVDGTMLGEVEVMPWLASRDPLRTGFGRRALYPISATEVYAPGTHAIYEWPSGNERAWPDRVETTSFPNFAAVSGGRVVHPAFHEVLAVPH